ncbi:MAG: hypothetical protein ABMB14_27560 [Myxococcota bacterium]
MWWIVAIGCRAEGQHGVDGPSTQGEPPSAAAGWEALRYGGYVGSGIPADLWFDLLGTDDENLLDRDGRSAGLDEAFNLFAAPNGVEVVGGVTCFGCHGGEIDGQFVPGLGDSRIDLRASQDSSLFDVLDSLIEARYGANSPEAEAYAPFAQGSAAVGPYTVAPFVGANPAFSIERAAVAHRDPSTLAWTDTLQYVVPDGTLWCDTPPLWNADRKSRLYWTGFGTGLPERMLMQISVVGLTDQAQAEEIVTDFDDIRAWMEALEPPPFPDPVDEDLAATGQQVFEASCASCHGTYGDAPTDPDRWLPLDEIGTDPTYALGFVNSPFVDWVGASWFGEGAVDPGDAPGYLAPPLDGIWATAPYLHNGSVPDLASLLDPALRPVRWRRDPLDTSLDHVAMGWPYTVPPADEANDGWTYDTTVVGAGNGGHVYGAALSADERAAVLEYLKTL